jgi:glycosyltransferase involved in cell wall biosynthesis
MRIAQVSPFFYPHIGGVESHVQTLSEKLVGNGHDVTVYTSNFGDLKEREIYRGVEVVRVKQTREIFYTPITPSLKKEMKPEKYDVVHAHTPPPLSSYYTARAMKKSKTPYVVTYHCDLQLPGIIGSLATAAYKVTLGRYTFKQTQKIIVHTKTYGATSRILWKFDVSVIPSAVNPEIYSENIDSQSVIARHGLEGKKLVLFVGRIVPHKGLDYLIYTAEFTPKNVSYLIVGRGDYLGSLRRKTREKGLEKRILFAGKVPSKKLPSYYAAADVFVLPSISRLEAFGLVVLEAMASAKPVIISNIPGVTELITDGEEGLHVEPMDAKDLADKINQILDDDELRKRMGETGREKVYREYSWDKVASQIEKIYEEVVGK